MNEKERILARFEKEKDRIFTPKWLAKSCRMEPGKVSYVLSKLMDEGKVKRVSRGMYKHAEKKKAAKKPSKKPAKKPAKKSPKKGKKKALSMKLSKENLARYLATLEKTCEIAIYELMLTEPFVGTDDKTEIEHQIAYFARHLVRSRWALEQEAFENVEVTEETFRRARKIHQWSKFVFEGRKKK
jgi:hypothetical protein